MRSRRVCGLLLLLLLASALGFCAPRVALAGTLTKADVQALFPPPLLVGEKLAHLPVWPVFVRTGQGLVLQNHVFETVDLEPVAGYGGKPINLLVVLDRDGAFVMTRLVSHTEPIFRSAEGTALLDRFGQQYQGLTVHHQVQVLGAKAQRVVTPTQATLHGIVAGTVTALAIDRSIMEAAAQVAQAHADPGAAARAKAAPASRADDRYARTGFNGLVATGLVQPWAVTNRALEARFAGSPGAGRDAEGMIRPDNPAVDLWLAFVGIPQAGRNLLTPARWQEVRAAREAGRTVLMVLDASRYPLGVASGAAGAASTSARLRGMRLHLSQGGQRFELAELPWTQGLRLSGQHSGVSSGSVARYYEVRAAGEGEALDPYELLEVHAQVWRRVAAADGSGVAAVTTAAASVELQRRFAIADAAAWRAVRESPRWLEPWAQRAGDLAVLGVALAVLSAALLWQRRTARTGARLAIFRWAFLAFTLVFVGWWAQGQLTVVTLTAAVEALAAGRSLEFLLLDPMAVVLWAFTLVTLFVWGRGTFCGWLCPFGALQELVAKAVALLGLRTLRRLRPQLDARLKRLKYAVLAVLLGAAAAAPQAAEWLVEVEPFKTAISQSFQRAWPYVAWAAACIAIGVFVYRAFCRYLCPLGAALALLARSRRWAWIPRHAQCGTPCQTCRHRCDYQAIAADGRVDYAECFQCLDCVRLHDDHKRCLPHVARARGKVIPIRPVAVVGGAE